ncbi:hypothetical protein HMPREF3039_02896 [Akkermansia sp. KLE1798]|nr:hypothetical protein HMPREF3039_02896 [Akkermansia sp. KLE1798]KZA03022.1 hypothetical protein HMPREF1326_03291 [Akkermansia sp. KLE1605]
MIDYSHIIHILLTFLFFRTSSFPIKTCRHSKPYILNHGKILSPVSASPC